MRVGMLGAGVGRRLGQEQPPPKILLEFGGQTLLARHVAILRARGVECMDLVVGYRAEDVRAEISRIGADDLIRTHFNAHFEDGAIVSFATLGAALRGTAEPVIFMDGDVLYDHRLMERLIGAEADSCFLMDRATEEGDDPVRLCMRGDRLVDFHKRPRRPYEWWGEWVGFCRFAPDIAAKCFAVADEIVRAGRRAAIYEDAIRQVVVSEPTGTFGVEDITGLPWVEIDFPEDLERARREIFPMLADPADPAAADDARAAGQGGA